MPEKIGPGHDSVVPESVDRQLSFQGDLVKSLQALGFKPDGAADQPDHPIENEAGRPDHKLLFEVVSVKLGKLVNTCKLVGHS